MTSGETPAAMAAVGLPPVTISWMTPVAEVTITTTRLSSSIAPHRTDAAPRIAARLRSPPTPGSNP